MPLNIQKPIDKPDHISILLPTRGRPSFLEKVFASLDKMTADKSLLDVWVYVDEDDNITNDYIRERTWESHDFEINWCVEARVQNMGEMFNLLRERCASNPGIYCTFGDDFVVGTRGWDTKVREAIATYPDRIALVYPHEPTSLRDQVTFAWLSAEWTNALGKIMTEYFPYWGDDSWLDQVAQLAGRKIAVDVSMDPIDSGREKSSRMWNLLFWRSFFLNMTEQRIEEAELLIHAVRNSGHVSAFDTDERKRITRRLRKARYRISYTAALIDEYENAGCRVASAHLERLYAGLTARAVRRLRKDLRPLIMRCRMFTLLRVIENIWLGRRPYRLAAYQLGNLLWKLKRSRQSLGNKHWYGRGLRKMPVVGKLWVQIRKIRSSR